MCGILDRNVPEIKIQATDLVAANNRLKILFSFRKALNDIGHQRGLKMAATTVRKRSKQLKVRDDVDVDEQCCANQVPTVVVDSDQHVLVTHQDRLSRQVFFFAAFEAGVCCVSIGNLFRASNGDGLGCSDEVRCHIFSSILTHCVQQKSSWF